MKLVINPIKSLTPEKAGVNALKQQKDHAAATLKTERDRRKQAKATEKLQQYQQALARLALHNGREMFQKIF